MSINSSFFTVSQLVGITRLTPQAIYFALKKNKLQGHKENERWLVTSGALFQYERKKYSREFQEQDGELVFDPSKGEISIIEAAKRLGVSIQVLYYAIRIGKLPVVRKNHTIVLNIEDVDRFGESKAPRNSCECPITEVKMDISRVTQI